ncbi:MAG TPA: KpsF/GutQ family sugar-phosphate isomerase [Gammaproteobacteria bacterium]|nr:KpsF/GutQ family sugar-phosphate isomerase [Gammaproteobacteria bacterium]
MDAQAGAADQKLRALGRSVIETEAQALVALISRIDGNFVAACNYMLACQGRIVVLGMGKSGHIGGKLAATLASTGTPAFFVHPGEASHGDMGMITAKDVTVAISNSGETDEIIVLLPLIKRLGVPLITLTGNPSSTLARAASVNIDVSVAKEACPLGLAPTSSTVAALAMGDALAIALLQSRGFSAEDFALAHPGGTLGRRLLLRIGDIMHRGGEMPTMGPRDLLKDALVEMSRKGLGMTAIVDERLRVAGIFTDGDLRRALDRGVDVHSARMQDVMTRECMTVTEACLAAEALSLMQQRRINALLIVDAERTLLGVVNMHDMLRAGVV